jgi:hypothetical protein
MDIYFSSIFEINRFSYFFGSVLHRIVIEYLRKQDLPTDKSLLLFQTLAFHRGAAREAERRAVAVAAEQQVRNQDVCTSLQINLPVSVQVPVGQRNKDFNYRIPEQVNNDHVCAFVGSPITI